MFLLVDIFDRVFDGDDTAGPIFTDTVDEGGDGGGFSRAGDAGNEDEAVFSIYDILPDVIRESDILYFWDMQGECTDCGADAIVFEEDIYSELQRADAIGGVDAVLVLEFLELFVANKGVDKLFCGLWGQGRSF